MILILGGAPGVAEGIARGLEARGEKADIDRDVDLASMREVRRRVAERKPRAVILAGGWDELDACEAEPDRAYVMNAETAIHLAAACMEFEATAIFLSTAEVFGEKGGPWFEADEPAPLSVYAKSRLRGEELLQRALPSALILRTGPVIADTVPLDSEGEERVSPIAAEDLGIAIAALLQAKVGGLFHVATRDPPVTRTELARSEAGGDSRGKPGRSPARKAPRARSPVLLAEKLARYLSEPLGSWKKALQARSLSTANPKETKMGHRQDVRRVDKPWGHEIIWAQTERYVGKVLFVKAGERLSLQYHEKKDETVYVLSGKMVFEVGPKDGTREDLIMKAGDSYHITPFTTHRMIALEDTHILEASTPELDDVVRLEDKYGRAGTKAP